ncbi:leucine-rich repeat protein [Porphyromonas sp. COT-108 OH2963]|uniref:leucine-rich repeat protein n=1 Tax=Porphyromonas sp. COT-108 OH2963 TaxID=1515614 RepID=UPI00068A145F|nr:leucine-rich repeat protein [Porphyromonas sp. COT-108 OH2963]
MKTTYLLPLCGLILLLTALSSCKSKNNPGGDVKTYYTVTFDADGGTPVPPAQKVEKGKTATVPSPAPTKQNFLFMAWSLDGTNAYDFQTPVTKDITLKAKWQEESIAEYWQVAWELNGGAWTENDNHPTQVPKGGILVEPNPPTKEGHTFEGWYREASLINKITFPYNVSGVTSDFTLYAKWEENEGGDEDPSGYKMFTSISAMKAWLDKQTANTIQNPYKVGLKTINLDNGNNWGDLGLSITKQNKYVDLSLAPCLGEIIPDGYQEKKEKGATGRPVIITYGVFIDCKTLVSIKLPNTLKNIGKYAFTKCTSLKNVLVPNSLKEIHSYAFEECVELEEVSLPEGLRVIGARAFSYCKSISSITIPSTISVWEDSSFERCQSLTSIIIKEGVNKVGRYAFWDCPYLQHVTLPQSIKQIDKGAFRGCEILQTLQFPDGITIIGEEAFLDCESLSEIKLPSELERIGKMAFRGCYMIKNKGKEVEIPSKVKYIEDYAFNNTKVEILIMRPTTPPSLGYSALDSYPVSLKSIKVPASSVETYKKAEGWKKYANKIVANTD